MLKNKIVIATRKSKLALWQAERVKQLLLARHPDLQIEFLALSSLGDEKQDVSLNKIGGKDLFVHHSEIKTNGYATLAENQKVQFEVGQGKKGPCATNVTPA